MFQTLISPADLAANLGQIRPLDCRAQLGDPLFGRRAFAAGHLPGAVHADLDTDLAAPPGAGGRHPLPDPEALAARLREWVVNDADQVVVYDDAGGAFAARAWWCLRWLGHAAVAVLDGGLAAWSAPLSNEKSARPVGNFSIRPSLTRTIEADELVRALTRSPSPTLVDARTQARFDGAEEPIDAIAGHIPGAVCMPFQANLEDDRTFLSPETLAERFAHLPEDPICYCGSGVTAAHNVLAMRVAGLPEPILYPGSWSEWIVDPSRPRAP